VVSRLLRQVGRDAPEHRFVPVRALPPLAQDASDAVLARVVRRRHQVPVSELAVQLLQVVQRGDGGLERMRSST
jgi:hypothetical protein